MVGEYYLNIQYTENHLKQIKLISISVSVSKTLRFSTPTHTAWVLTPHVSVEVGGFLLTQFTSDSGLIL